MIKPKRYLKERNFQNRTKAYINPTTFKLVPTSDVNNKFAYANNQTAKRNSFRLSYTGVSGIDTIRVFGADILPSGSTSRPAYEATISDKVYDAETQTYTFTATFENYQGPYTYICIYEVGTTTDNSDAANCSPLPQDIWYDANSRLYTTGEYRKGAASSDIITRYDNLNISGSTVTQTSNYKYVVYQFGNLVNNKPYELRISGDITNDNNFYFKGAAAATVGATVNNLSNLTKRYDSVNNTTIITFTAGAQDYVLLVGYYKSDGSSSKPALITNYMTGASIETGNGWVSSVLWKDIPNNVNWQY